MRLCSAEPFLCIGVRLYKSGEAAQSEQLRINPRTLRLRVTQFSFDQLVDVLVGGIVQGFVLAG